MKTRLLLPSTLTNIVLEFLELDTVWQILQCPQCTTEIPISRTTILHHFGQIFSETQADLVAETAHVKNLVAFLLRVAETAHVKNLVAFLQRENDANSQSPGVLGQCLHRRMRNSGTKQMHFVIILMNLLNIECCAIGKVRYRKLGKHFAKLGNVHSVCFHSEIFNCPKNRERHLSLELVQNIMLQRKAVNSECFLAAYILLCTRVARPLNCRFGDTCSVDAEQFVYTEHMASNIPFVEWLYHIMESAASTKNILIWGRCLWLLINLCLPDQMRIIQRFGSLISRNFDMMTAESCLSLTTLFLRNSFRLPLQCLPSDWLPHFLTICVIP